ncbi:MAG: hypothetical protein IKX50_09555 [Spirochaetia bacterium]|nr:hypothetical protein [Spirochaetia bacterium]
MRRKVLSDVELRSRHAEDEKLVVEQGTIITPAAMDYIRQHGIELETGEKKKQETMTVAKIPVKEGKFTYVDYETGEELDHKPEEMTHLFGNKLVSKTHPRIAFRGALDSLMAEVMWTQTIAIEEHYSAVCADLEEVLMLLRKVMSAEVRDVPLEKLVLLGMDSARMRQITHHMRDELKMDHPVPSYKFGKMCTALNRLRTCVRVAELAAARAFYEGKKCTRVDIVETMNRLSSCIYIMYCKVIGKIYQVDK